MTLHYRNLTFELFSEALFHYAKYIRALPEDSPTGQLVVTLERLICALQHRPFTPMTEAERRLRTHAVELFAAAKAAVNGPDTTEGRAKLYLLITELEKGN